MKSLQGQLLLASSKLLDPNFVHTVILMVQHSEEGALGLILNRPLETTIKQVCEQPPLELPCTLDSPLYKGGPCDGPLMVLHNHEIGGQIEIVPDVHFTTDRSQIEPLLTSEGADVKCFVGYAGWEAGQLENEMETGSWLTLPADKGQIFQDDGDDDGLWSKLMAKVTLGRWIDPSQIPDDPNVN
jgi:putative transcriptional regulator